MCVLVANGFDDEAFGLSRTMLEIAISARYIVNESSDWLANRYVKYFAKDHENWTNMITKHYPNAVASYHSAHGEMLDEAKTFDLSPQNRTPLSMIS